MYTIFAHTLLPISSPPVQNGYITVDKGRIVAMGAMGELPDSPEKDAFIYDNDNISILAPGFVNAHCHLEQSFSTPVEKTPEQPMSDWLKRVTERNRQYSSPEDTEARCIRGVKALLASGTTCVNDISGMHGLTLGVLEEVGLRGIVSPEFFHPAPDPVNLKSVFDIYRELTERVRNHSLLQVGLSPHTPFNVSASAWRVLLKECTDPGSNTLPIIHTHIAESKDELAWVSGKVSDIDTLHAMFADKAYPPLSPHTSSVLYMKHYGLLTESTIAAHLIYTSAEDRRILKDSGVKIVHCPRSNLYLQNETLNWQDWLGSGIPIGLGTDGQLSTETLDIRDEARTAMTHHGISAANILELMTLGGARVMGLDSEIGTLAVGKSADYALWSVPDSLGGLSAEDQLLAPETILTKLVVAGRSLDIPKKSGSRQ